MPDVGSADDNAADVSTAEHKIAKSPPKQPYQDWDENTNENPFD